MIDRLPMCAAAAVVLLAMLLGGCAGFAVSDVDSLDAAGVSTLETEIVVGDADDVALGTEYDLALGKEYGELGVSLTWQQDAGGELRPVLEITASKVAGFRGQEAAASAVTEIQRELSAMGVELGDDATSVLSDVLSRLVTPAP